MDGTRLQILRDIEDWILSSRAQQIFWLAGMAGTGKTAIAQTVCSRMSLHKTVLLGGSFFCSRSTGSITQRDVRCVIPTLAQLLARQSAQFSEALAAELSRDPDILHKQASVQIDILLYNPLCALKGSHQPIVFVIDALDECGGQLTSDEGANDAESHRIVSEMLEALVKFSCSTVKLPVKFLVTSRPETHIRDTPVSDDTFSTIFHLHNVSKAQVTADIRLYISRRLSSSQLLCDSFTTSDVDMLAQVCDGLFIVATTALQYTLGKGIAAAPSRFKTLLNATRKSLSGGASEPLDRMYDLILADAAENGRTDDEELKAMLKLLGCILSARMALSVVNLAELLGIDSSDVHARLSRLHAVVHVPNDDTEPSLRTLHASFGDYLLGRAPGNIRISVSLGHDVLARGCLRIMAQRLRFNISQSKSSHFPNSATRPEAITISLEYACLHWVYHSAAATAPSEFDAEIDVVFRSCFLFWLEVASVLGQVERATAILFFAASTVRGRRFGVVYPSHNVSQVEMPNLLQFFRDAHAFVTSSTDLIKQSAPHIYISALPFAAKSSLIYRTFSPRCTGVISVETSGAERHPGHFIMALTGHEMEVNSVAYSPDGRFIASGSNDGTVRVWDVRSGEDALSPLHSGDGPIWSLAFSLSGRRVAAGTESGIVCMWALHGSHATLQRLLGHKSKICSVAFSPNGVCFASASVNEPVRIWYSHANQSIGVLLGRIGVIVEIAFSPDGKILACAFENGTIQLWTTATGKPAGEPLQGAQSRLSSICFSPTGTILASTGSSGDILFWSVETRSPIQMLRGDANRITCVRFSPDERSVVSTSDNHNVRLWTVQPQSAEPLSIILKGHSHRVLAASFSPSGLNFATASADHTIRIWDVGNGQQLAEPQTRHERRIHSMAVSPDGLFLVSGSGDHSVSVWNTQTREKLLPPLQGHTSAVHSVAIAVDGLLIASASADCTVRIWDPRTGTSVGDPRVGHTDVVRAVTFWPSARLVASGSSDKTVRIWPVGPEYLPGFSVLKCAGAVHSVAISPDARVLAAGADNGSIYLWDADTGAAMPTFRSLRSKTTHHIAFSADSSLLVSGNENGQVYVHSLLTRFLLRILSPAHEDPSQMLSVAFSPDSRFICGGSSRGRISIWGVSGDGLDGSTISAMNIGHHLKLLKVLPDHSGEVHSVAFIRDVGQSIVSADNETIRVWNANTSHTVSFPCCKIPGVHESPAVLREGWFVSKPPLGRSLELLLGVPVEYRKYFPGYPCRVVISDNRVSVTIGSDGWYCGEDWIKIWRDETDNIGPERMSF